MRGPATRKRARAAKLDAESESLKRLYDDFIQLVTAEVKSLFDSHSNTSEGKERLSQMMEMIKCIQSERQSNPELPAQFAVIPFHGSLFMPPVEQPAPKEKKASARAVGRPASFDACATKAVLLKMSNPSLTLQEAVNDVNKELPPEKEINISTLRKRVSVVAGRPWSRITPETLEMVRDYMAQSNQGDACKVGGDEEMADAPLNEQTSAAMVNLSDIKQFMQCTAASEKSQSEALVNNALPSSQTPVEISGLQDDACNAATDALQAAETAAAGTYDEEEPDDATSSDVHGPSASDDDDRETVDGAFPAVRIKQEKVDEPEESDPLAFFENIVPSTYSQDFEMEGLVTMLKPSPVEEDLDVCFKFDASE